MKQFWTQAVDASSRRPYPDVSFAIFVNGSDLALGRLDARQFAVREAIQTVRRSLGQSKGAATVLEHLPENRTPRRHPTAKFVQTVVNFPAANFCSPSFLHNQMPPECLEATFVFSSGSCVSLRRVNPPSL